MERYGDPKTVPPMDGVAFGKLLPSKSAKKKIVSGRPANDFLSYEPDAPISARPGPGRGQPAAAVPTVINCNASHGGLVSPQACIFTIIWIPFPRQVQ
jgi:hypothetical protein